MLEALHEQAQQLRKQREEAASGAGTRRAEMETARARLIREQKHVMAAIKEGCGSRIVYAELKEIEEKLERLNEVLDAAAQPPIAEITRQEVRSFLEQMITRFEELLLGDPEKIKAEFLRRIGKLVVTPVENGQRGCFQITGDVELFALSGDVVQTNQVPLLGLHYKISVDVPFGRYPIRNK